MGTYKIMGPGFFPLVLGILLVACTGLHLIRVIHAGRKGRGAETPSGSAPPRVPDAPGDEKGLNYTAIAGIVVATCAYPFILGYAKFVGATAAVGLVMFLTQRPKRFLPTLFISLAMAVGCFLVFSRLFGVALPSGPVEDLLFRIGG